MNNEIVESELKVRLKKIMLGPKQTALERVKINFRILRILRSQLLQNPIKF